ncbi:MAG: hypothetical protein ACFFA3_19135 [Promethearchaeota archaeon]
MKGTDKKILEAPVDKKEITKSADEKILEAGIKKIEEKIQFLLVDHLTVREKTEENIETVLDLINALQAEINNIGIIAENAHQKEEQYQTASNTIQKSLNSRKNVLNTAQNAVDGKISVDTILKQIYDEFRKAFGELMKVGKAVGIIVELYLHNERTFIIPEVVNILKRIIGITEELVGGMFESQNEVLEGIDALNKVKDAIQSLDVINPQEIQSILDLIIEVDLENRIENTFRMAQNVNMVNSGAVNEIEDELLEINPIREAEAIALQGIQPSCNDINNAVINSRKNAEKAAELAKQASSEVQDQAKEVTSDINVLVGIAEEGANTFTKADETLTLILDKLNEATQVSQNLFGSINEIEQSTLLITEILENTVKDFEDMVRNFDELNIYLANV